MRRLHMVYRDISPSGLYLLTEGRWYPGTMVMLTLQKNGEIVAGSEQSIAVEAKVIRSGDDGVGLAFVLPERRKGSDKEGPWEIWSTRKPCSFSRESKERLAEAERLGKR